MEYIIIIILFAVAAVILAIHIVASLFPFVWAIVIIAWLLSKVCQVFDLEKGFDFFYTTFYLGIRLAFVWSVIKIIKIIFF